MELKDLELEAYVPLLITLLEVKPKVSVASAAIVTAKRSDGDGKLVGIEITIPQCHIHIDSEGKPVRAWIDKHAHVSGLLPQPYEIELPLMPKASKKEKEGDGEKDT